MKLFEFYATESRRRLNLYVTINTLVYIPLDHVFEPQPTIYNYMSESMRKFISTVTFMISSRVNEGPSSPTMTIRKEDKYKNWEMQIILKHLQSVFSIVAQGFISSKSWEQKLTAHEICNELQTKIGNFIDTNIHGAEPRTWTSTADKHEDKEITFSIPNYLLINGHEEKICVLISFTGR